MDDDQRRIGGWRAHVSDVGLMRSLQILIGQRTSTGFLYLTGITGDLGFGFGTDTEHVESAQAPPDRAHLRIPEDAARALYDALAQHFAGEAGGRQTRTDLMHERGRVDRLIETLATVATTVRTHP